MVQAAPRPDPVPAPDASAAPEPKMIPAVPMAMAWLGSIGGVLGIISFTESYITRLVEAIKKATNPHHDTEKGDPPWVVGVQVGLDGHGLNVSHSRVLPFSTKENQYIARLLYHFPQRPKMYPHWLTLRNHEHRELAVIFLNSACGIIMASC